MLTEKIRDGSYFEEAREWYSEVYLSLISERVFYIILTAIAVFTSLIALIGLIRLLPIVPAEPFIIRSNDAAHELPLIRRLAERGGEETNVALRRFMVKRYVTYRENYARDKIAPFARVIYKWSTQETYDVYRRYIDTSNPRSPVIRYESTAEREVEVESIDVQPNPSAGENAYIAKVNFVAYVIRLNKMETSKWTSEVSFVYKDATVDQEKVDEKTGRMKVTPMEFAVTAYNVRERKDEIGQ